MATAKKLPLQPSSLHNSFNGGNTAKKLPLQPSSLHNSFNGGTSTLKKKTIEEMCQKKTQLEHILLRPDTYIGCTEKRTQVLWVYENGELVHRPVTYVPGLYKIFDELLVNVANNKQRDPTMDSVKVDIDQAGNCVSVYNNGDGIPVEFHSEVGVYVPELIFGHLLTSSNYDDNVKKTTGGRNGYGVKLTNIFSTEFVIQTADGKRQRKYKQMFSENMGKKSEPSITKCEEGENWTKVIFKPDLAKFKMDYLEDDVVALMKKRVLDLAGTLGKSVKVELNGVRVPIKSFSDYVDMYLQSTCKSRSEPLPKIVEKLNDRWEVCVSLSEGQFQQVSFVNGISTIKGGTHVEHVTQQIANHVMAEVNEKNKNANLKAHIVRNHLWVFVNALIENPAFDSQTKETLTTRPSSFGSKCELSKTFLTKVAKSGVVNSLLSWADFKQSKELKKTDGIKRQRIPGILKLEDANHAGGKNSEKCTLILTQGNSAKALAMAGISMVDRNYYGVFPLTCKLLNVRDANHKEIMENAEIQNIKHILGLQYGKEYESTKGLRYGHLMIMTDQDHDGSHIKGLLINFIHSFWPSLLKIPSFIAEFITPIVKATHSKNKTVLSFYSMLEFEAWKDSLGGNANAWAIKYYKGLGTSTSKEGKEYFQDIEKHKKDFVWIDENDGDTIELAFSKNKMEARMNCIRQFAPGTYLDHRGKSIKYSEFVNKELMLFSMADLRRSIPSMVDGLKPGQRKILFCSFKRNFIKEAKVAQFEGYVSEHSAYHHVEQSSASTIIGMAQDFVGSNNINLLQPNGQFGTRHQGGKDHASARYIYTRLSPLTRFLFPKDDDILLEYQTEDGHSIEPVWYMPIIPMVLVNGSEGIGTGWSTSVPNYNPRDIIANVKRLLNGEPMELMDPWYRGFKGVIEKSATKEAGATYTITGVIEQVDSTTLRITELPIRRWTQDYKEFLETLMTGNDKIKEPFIKDYREDNDDVTVHFEVTLTEENMNIAIQEGLEKKFKLATTIATTNMHLFDSKGVIKKYDTPEQILEEFFHKRLDFYAKQKGVLLDNLELDLLKLDNKVRFILGVIEGEIVVSNRKRAHLLLELKQKGFIPFTKKTKGMVAGSPSAEEDDEDMSPEAVAGGVIRANDYEYLLSMPIGTLTLEKVQQLCAERDKLEAEVEELRKASPKSLWMKDLDALDKELDVQEKKDVEVEGARKEMWEKALAAGGTALKSVRKPRKNDAVLTEANMDDANYMPQSSNLKVKGAQKRAGAKKSAEVVNHNVDEVLELKECLSAYNLENLSSDHSGMETESSADQAKQIPIEAPQPQEKKKRGRKPAVKTNEKGCLAAYNLENLSADHTEMEAESSAGQAEQITIEALKPRETKKRGRKAAAETNEKERLADHTEMETESSADQVKQKPIEAPHPQEKKKRGRKPAAKTNEKGCLAAYNIENLSVDHTVIEPEFSVGEAKQMPIEAPEPQEKKKRGRTTAAETNEKECLAPCNLENHSPDHTEKEAESSAGQAKQIAIEALEPQDKKKRGRKPAAETNEKECVAAYNLQNLSPDHTEMEAESSVGQAKQIPIEAPQPQEKKKRGRKPAVVTDAKPKAAAAGRKRGPASQKANATNTGKQTNTRASPVNKKRRGEDGSSGDMDEVEEVAVVARRERPKRGNAKKAVYVESDSEKDNNESDFE